MDVAGIGATSRIGNRHVRGSPILALSFSPVEPSEFTSGDDRVAYSSDGVFAPLKHCSFYRLTSHISLTEHCLLSYS